MIRLIGMCGKKGTGKNFVAERIKHVVEKYGKHVEQRTVYSYPPDVQLVAFAEPLKEFGIEVLGLDRAASYGSDKDKNAPTKYTWSQMPDFVKAKYPEKVRRQPNNMTIREVLQTFGTEFMRDCWDLEIWINAMARRIRESKSDLMVITDARFENEIASIKSLGGEIWTVSGPQRGDEFAKNDKHVTETLLDGGFRADYTVTNELGYTARDIDRQVMQRLFPDTDMIAER